MATDTTRRRLLAGSVALATAGLAGCTGEWAGDDDADDTADDTADDDPPGDDHDDGADDVGESATLGETAQLGDIDSVVFEMHSLDPAMDFEFVGRIHGANLYYEYAVEGQTIEYYIVDGDFYMVMDDVCYANPGDGQDPAAMDPEDEVAIGTHEDFIQDHPDVEWIDRDEIDGVAVYVYELGDDGMGGELTYYVETDTGLLRRVESGEFVIDYHSWGDADPVSAPDVECMEF